MSIGSILAPLSNSNSMMRRWPVRQAQMRGVSPFEVAVSTLAPWLRSCKTGRWQLTQDRGRGVGTILSTGSTLAPFAGAGKAPACHLEAITEDISMQLGAAMHVS